MDNILQESEALLREIDYIGKFGNKFSVSPYHKVLNVARDLKRLASSLPEIKTPNNKTELIQAEMKRRLFGEAMNLEQRVSSKPYAFETVTSMFGIPQTDLDSLKDWLLSHKEATMNSIERLYNARDILSYELHLPVDIPSIKKHSESVATVAIDKYHQKIGSYLRDLTKVGNFLRDIRAVPTTEARSYFHPLTNTLAIGIPAICFSTEDGGLEVRKRDLITLYGHEGMGHALNHVVSKENAQLPFFLKKSTILTMGTEESIAQFYEKQIFEDLKNSPIVQKDLDIEHVFSTIYQEAKDFAQLREYNAKLFQYAITVLGDKSFGNPEDVKTIRHKIDLLQNVALDPSQPVHFVESYRQSFDSEGNLNAGLVSELRYCAQPVKRAFDIFNEYGMQYVGETRSIIDKTLLTGFWTPEGYVDHARLVAQGKMH